MTRINCVPVQELCNKHLFAEFREMPRLVANLNQSLNRKSKPFSMSEIPSQYKLGSGHVKFFYDKFAYLNNRYNDLKNELLLRGFNISSYNALHFKSVPSIYFNDWKPTERDMELNRARIKERMPVNAKWSKIIKE